MDTLLTPLLYAVSWIMLGWHWLFAQVFGTDSGMAWTLSVVGLVVVIRTLLIPLFVRQIKASRKLQIIQPQMKELQKKYGHDKEKMTQEVMALYKTSGTNPLASCLPILLQAPIFFALFRVLDGIAIGKPRGAFADHLGLYKSAQHADFFGIPGVPFTSSFRTADNLTTQVVAVILVIIMTATTFLTQRQLMRKNMPESALTGPFAQQQKILLYVLPLVFAFSGVTFPLGVVLYWCVSNLWTMGQQFFVIRRMPAPGTPAEEAYRRRQEAKATRRGRTVPHTELPAAAAAGAGGPSTGAGTGPSRDGDRPGSPSPPRPARQPPRSQPRKQSRSQRKKRS